MNRNSYIILIIGAIVLVSGYLGIYFYFQLIPVPTNSEDQTSKIFTVCHPVEDHDRYVHNRTGYIQWSKNYCLKWGDFKGHIDPTLNKVAYTYTDTQRYFEVKVLNSSNPEFEFIDIHVVPYFVESTSWVNRTAFNPQDITILRHEQGHFDIAEEHATNAEIKMKSELMNKTFPFQIITNDKQKDAESQANNLIDKIWREVYPELNQTNVKYDHDTGNGTKLLEQIQYNEKFDHLLRN